MARLKTAAVLAGLILLAGACAAPPPSGPAPEVSLRREVDALLALGQERLERGRPAEAADAFQAVLDKSSQPEARARAWLGLARSRYDRQRLGEAMEALLSLGALAAPAEVAARAELLTARVELAQGRAAAAAGRLRKLMAQPPAALPPAQERQARELMVQALLAQDLAGEAASLLVDQAREADPTDLHAIAQRLAQVAGRTPAAELKPLLARARDPKVRAALLMGLAQAHLRTGRLVEAGRILEELRASPAAGPWMERIRELDSQLGQARLVEPRAVGVVLPLSGTYGSFGKRVLAAVELGLGLFSAAGGAQPPTLYIEDSRSSAQAAAQAVTKLVQQRRVAAIIGPLGAGTSLAAARRAQQLGVPLITLSQVEGVTLAGDCVFQNFYTPEDQVAALLEQVMGAWGLAKLAVLAPDNSYGRGFAQLMGGRAAARGGKLVRSVFYQPEQTDFAVQIKELVHLPLGDYRPGYPESPQPVIDFQALLVPDGPERAAMIAPQLAYFDVLGVQLMGTSLWHDPRLISVGGRYVEGCLFPDAFNAQSSEPLVRGFVRDFRQALGSEPSTVAAHGYDAGLMLRHLMQSADPPRTRAQMRRRLAGLSGLRGVCGRLSMGPQRRVQKEMTLFTVQGGRFLPLGRAGLAPPGPEPEAPGPSGGPGEAAPGGSGGRDGEAGGGRRHTVLPLRPAPAASVMH
jgi:ABC-type branched-subunit amino acid transport system substrate-binding protein